MSDECCPIHGPSFRSFSEQYGVGCKKKLEAGSPYANKNNYCRWRPGATGFDGPKPNGAARPGSSVSTARSYGKSPEESRSIVAQVAMKCAVELYCSAFSIAPATERQNLLAELISAANRINENIGRMAEPRREAPKPAPRPEPQADYDDSYTPAEEYGDLESGRYDT